MFCSGNNSLYRGGCSDVWLADRCECLSVGGTEGSVTGGVEITSAWVSVTLPLPLSVHGPVGLATPVLLLSSLLLFLPLHLLFLLRFVLRLEIHKVNRHFKFGHAHLFTIYLVIVFVLVCPFHGVELGGWYGVIRGEFTTSQLDWTCRGIQLELGLHSN